MSNVVPLQPPLYEAKLFKAGTALGQFSASGTLCGHIDFLVPSSGSIYPLSPDEALAVIVMLQQARADVLANSDPFNDPRLIASPAAPGELGDAPF